MKKLWFLSAGTLLFAGLLTADLIHRNQPVPVPAVDPSPAPKPVAPKYRRDSRGDLITLAPAIRTASG